MKQGFKIFILGLILLIGLVITYSNHFMNGFHFDDFHAINDNIYIRSLKNIPHFFSHPEMFSSLPSHWGLRPLVTSSLAIDYWLAGGLNPFYFQLSTFIVFALLAVVLYFVYNKIIKTTGENTWSEYFALFAAGLYALHTANAETVNYIISRSDVQSSFFIVLSFAIFILYPNQRKKYFYLIPALIGVLAKETVLVLPVLLFFYITLFEKNMSLSDLLKPSNFKITFKSFLVVVPIFIVVGALQYYTLSKALSISENTSTPFFYYIITQPFIWVHYFITFFIPMNLSADTDWTIITNPFDDRIIIGLIFISLLVYTIFKTSVKKETRPISFGLIWFSFSLLPTSIMPLTEVMNDHRIFFPFIGLAFSVVCAIRLFILKHQKIIETKSKYQRFIFVAALLVLSSYAYGAFQRNKVWKDEESLWLDVTIKSPENGRGLMNYGLTQMNKANYDIALLNFEKALIYCPYYSTLHINLGIIKNVLNRSIEAEDHFKKSIQYEPTSPSAYYYYSNFLKQHNRLGEARQMAEKALDLNSAYMDARYTLMAIYSDLELWDNLKTTAEKTLELLPSDKVSLTYLDASMKRQSKIDASVELAKNSQTPESYLNLSMMYYQKGLFEKCIEASYEAIKLKPDYADAYNNIGAAYNSLGKFEEAVKACEKAIQLKPDFQLAKNNLNWAKSQIK
ncbi:MAG: tetratricopeptide repeat protein [Bacteroidota bacterium]